ncbi:hypothetical protein AAFF_G00158080 [Aldrovandia affinis]|uniref:Uncharacterized protein n=1 Tax=Aldrovandia affinis TaxID=143900 RepID=A0AAD7W827_9TELE|nr:hypothetical protein AAFF_G00158080 [Aldrovandia affinis]
MSPGREVTGHRNERVRLPPPHRPRESEPLQTGSQQAEGLLATVPLVQRIARCSQRSLMDISMRAFPQKDYGWGSQTSGGLRDIQTLSAETQLIPECTFTRRHTPTCCRYGLQAQRKGKFTPH